MDDNELIAATKAELGLETLTIDNHPGTSVGGMWFLTGRRGKHEFYATDRDLKGAVNALEKRVKDGLSREVIKLQIRAWNAEQTAVKLKDKAALLAQRVAAELKPATA